MRIRRTVAPGVPAAETPAGQSVDLSVFTDMMKDRCLYPSPVHGNGAALQSALEPLFQAYFAGQKSDSVLAQTQSQCKTLPARS